MKQFVSFSSEVLRVINKFDKKVGVGRLLSFIDTLAVSLYAQRPDADSKVTEILKGYIVDLGDYLETEEIELLNQAYKDVVFVRLKNSGRDSRTKYGWSTLPCELVDLCHALASTSKEAESLFLPYAGDGVFLESLSADVDCQGFELDPELWALAQIKLNASGMRADIHLGETFPLERSYDRILAFPPIAGKDYHLAAYLEQLATKHLTPGGSMVCLLPESTFYRVGSWKRFREAIVSSDQRYSVMVVALPKGVLPHTRISLYALVVTNDEQGSIVLADTSSDDFMSHHYMGSSRSSGIATAVLKVDAIIETIKTCDQKLVWAGSFDKLDDRYSLRPSFYIPIDPETPISASERRLSVGSIVERVKFTRGRKGCLYPTVGARQLADTYINCDIHAKDLPAQEWNLGHRLVTEDCLLVCFIGGKMKVGKLLGVSEDRPVAVDFLVLPLKLKTGGLITESYFLKAVTSDFALKQANAWSLGGFLGRLSPRDLKRIELIVPRDIREQEEQYNADLRSAMGDNALRILEQFEDFRKDTHMKKHAVGQTLFNLKNWWKVLESARCKGNGVVCDTTEVSSARKITVADIYDNLEKAIAKLHEQLSKFDTGYGLSQEEFDLVEFVEAYIDGHQSPLFTFDFPRDESLQMEEKKDIHVTFSREALKMVLNNIISNAVSHGFSEDKRDENKIRIGLEARGSDYVLTVANNGAPLKITEEDVFIYGQTSGETEEHFGIGGYEIKKLMNEFDGDAELISSPDKEFTVTYRLVFHNTGL